MIPITECPLTIIAPVFIVTFIESLMAGSTSENRPHLADVHKLNVDLFCLVSGLLIAPFLAALLGLSETQSSVLLPFASLPPAVLNFLLAERYQREPKQVASIVLIGNLASVVFVPVALAFALK